MRRRLLFIVVGFLAGLVVVIATVPLWLGAAARSAGQSRGITFSRYERIGYARFALHDAEYRRGNVRVFIQRAEAETPLLWWWHRRQLKPGMIVAGDWRVEVERSTAPSAPPATDRGWLTLRGQLQRIAAVLDRWLPRAQTGAGVVRWPGGGLTLASAKWATRTLSVDDVVLLGAKFDATVAFEPEDSIRVEARLDDDSAQAKLVSRGPGVSGEVKLWEQPAAFTAKYATAGWLPAEATVRAQDWRVPGARLKLGEQYATVRGSAQIEWRTEKIFADVTATGEPVTGKSVPPLAIAVRGYGDMQAFTIESLNATLPGVDARLSNSVTVERTGRIRDSGARFTLQADLAKMPWLTATGAVTGDARVVQGESGPPVVEFALAAKDVHAKDVSLAGVNATGRLDWPRLHVTEGVITAGDDERLTWSGGWDFTKRKLLDAAVAGTIRRASLARWLPKQPEFDAVKIDARASGSLEAIRHHGVLTAAGVKVSALNPLAVTADWRGSGATLEEIKATVETGSVKIQAQGSLEKTGATLSKLDLIQAGTPRLQLAGPATVRWQPQLQLDALRLAGSEGSINAALTWGESGRVEVSVRELPLSWFHDLLAKPGPAVTVSLLALVGSWDRGPMEFSLAAGGKLELGNGRTVAANVSARGDKTGIQIGALRAMESETAVINATGRVPITIVPRSERFLRIEEHGALSLDAAVAPNSAFWQQFAEMSGVELKEPTASAKLKGTWLRPEGNVSLKAARIAVDPKRIARPLPTIESLEIEVTGNREGITLGKCSVRIEDQLVQAEGRLPVPDGQWAELFQSPLATAKRGADLRLQIPDAEVAVFARFLPAVLAQKGRLAADLRYQHGGVEGYLRLRDAASRPLGPLGVLQEISADVAMSGRKFALRGVTAKSGGQPVTLSGTVEIPDSGEPRFDLALRGENLPFMRQTGLLLRGDLDLKLQTPDTGPSRLVGNVQLRESLFLSDIRAFLPKGGASASRRPPYFAIETPPINAWTLAVDVVGEKFMRMRTPVFTGVASARFRLGGTLGEPRAVGEISIDEGSVRMPFASFTVTQASVRLTEADPFEPEIYVRGTGRRYGYDLAMEIDGSASQPNVVFTSSPPLDSEQVLLMVMTGSAPSNEITRSATQRVANIGLYLSQSLLGSLGSDAAEADRLSFASGEKISRQGRETYDIAYKISDRWTLTGEYNEFDEYAAGVKWRVFPRKKPGEGKAEEDKSEGKGDAKK